MNWADIRSCTGIDGLGVGLSHSPITGRHTGLRWALHWAWRQRRLAAVSLSAVVAACSSQSAPVAAPAANAVARDHGSVSAASRPHVQKAVVDYLEKTINALPPGSYLDGSAMPVGGSTVSCAGTDPASPMVRFEVSMTVVRSAPIQADQITAAIVALWRSWGVHVAEDQNTGWPGWSADTIAGYHLHIDADHRDRPPVVSVSSICFPDDVVLRDLPFPSVISHSP